MLLLSLDCSTYPWSDNVVLKQGGIKYHFWIFGLTRLWTEPRSPGPFANSLTTMPNVYNQVLNQAWFVTKLSLQNDMNILFRGVHFFWTALQRTFRAHFLWRQNDSVPDRKSIFLWFENFIQNSITKWAQKVLCVVIIDSPVKKEKLRQAYSVYWPVLSIVTDIKNDKTVAR